MQPKTQIHHTGSISTMFVRLVIFTHCIISLSLSLSLCIISLSLSLSLSLHAFIYTHTYLYILRIGVLDLALTPGLFCFSLASCGCLKGCLWMAFLLGISWHILDVILVAFILSQWRKKRKKEKEKHPWSC